MATGSGRRVLGLPVFSPARLFLGLPLSYQERRSGPVNHPKARWLRSSGQKTAMRSSPLCFRIGSSRSKKQNLQQAMKNQSRCLRSLGSSRASQRHRPKGCVELVVKFGLDRFLQEHSDPPSEQLDSAYADLVRLTGHDPVAEITARLRSDQ